MIKYDFLPVILIVFVKWTIFSHVVSGKHVVIKIQVPKLINHQHHTNLVLVHKYKKPIHHHHIVPYHHDDHHYHHHYGHNHHHHHASGGHHGGHHKTSHGNPNLHHHSHSYGHHHHVSFGHGHPPIHHPPKPKPTPKPKPKSDPKKDPKHHKSNHYTVGGFFNLASAYKHKHESEKNNLPINDEKFESITDVPTNSHDFQVENIKTSPETHNNYEVHEDHSQDYSSDYHHDKNLDYPFKDSDQNEELKDYAEDYTNPYSVSKFTSNIEHGSIKLEENHYNPDHQSEISEYVNEYNESDYDT